MTTVATSAPTVAIPSSAFKPSTTEVPTANLDDSSQIVTLPYIKELHNPNYLDALLPPIAPSKAKSSAPVAPNAFMTALREDVGNRTTTWNGADAFVSTLSSTLDAFSTLGPTTSGAEIHSLLHKSWQEDKDLTLRIIWNLRSIHEGKSEKDKWYHAFGWLYKNHPRTAISNLPELVNPIIERAKKKPKKTEEGNADAIEEDEWTDVKSEGGKAEGEEAEVKKDYRSGYAHGYYKDLLNILSLATLDQLTDPSSTFTALYTERPAWTYDEGDEGRKKMPKRVASPTSRATPDVKITKRQKRAARRSVPETHAQKKAREVKAAHERLTYKLNRDSSFRALYIAVARIFANRLAEEISILKRISEPNMTLTAEEHKELVWKIGFASKWAPSLHGAHDRLTNIATAIAHVLQASGNMSELPVPFDANSPLSAANAAKVRGFYRRWVISPLRRQIQVPEVAMSANKWNHIDYARVPSTCMKNNKTRFFEHDDERFAQYLKDVASGKKTITGATLLPHELVGEVGLLKFQGLGPEAEINVQVIEGQWNALVERLRESGSLDNCLAVCDVSGSMGSYGSSYNRKSVQPIFPSLALSLIVAQLAKPPFANAFITFSSTPQLVKLDPTQGLVATLETMIHSDWGMNTDFQAVFMNLILPLALKHQIKKEDMVKRLFVFSDMQFDAALSGQGYYGQSVAARTGWATNHDSIKEAYGAAGYDVPEIVYWNLAGARNVPILKDEPGVAMLSGFSGNMLKLFMDGDEEELLKAGQSVVVGADGEMVEEDDGKPKIDPVTVMKKALGKKSFDGLRVFD